MKRQALLEKNVPESHKIGDFLYVFEERPSDPNAHFVCTEDVNVPRITMWFKKNHCYRSNPKYAEHFKWTFNYKGDEVDRHWNKQKDTAHWYGINELEHLENYIDVRPTYATYPPAIHGEVKWTERMLTQDPKLHRGLLRCVGSEPNHVSVTPEWETEEGKRIDAVFMNGEFDENDDMIEPEYWSVEAMDKRGLCDDDHFAKAVSTYPMAVERVYGYCTGVILVAADFTPGQIKRANVMSKSGWPINCVKAEEIDGKTKFTLCV